MAAPSYTTDLSTVTQAEESGTPPTGWAEPTATNWTSLNQVTGLETDFFIQNTNCISATVKTGVGGYLYDSGASGITIPADGAVLVWGFWSAPNSLATEANGGMRVVIGSALNAFYYVNSGGNDFAPNPYGGWQCMAMGDPSAISATAVGSPGATRRYLGWCYNAPTTAPTKGNPFGIDAIRYGRCEMRINGGDGGGYATFPGYAAVNDTVANRWGLFQDIGGSYRWQGLMTLGYSSAVDFRDSNRVIMIANTKNVTAAFNKIEIRQATSRVDWTNITFVALGTVSKGRLEVIDDCDVNISGCTFNGMDTFIFKATSDVLISTFLNCGAVTANGAKFNGTKFTGFTGAADASQLIWDTNADVDGKIDGCSFTKGANATHAIQLGTNAPTSVTIRNCSFSGYNASNAQSDSTINVMATGGTVTINVVNCSGNISYKTAGATVVIASNPVTVKVTVKDTAVPPVAIQSARVLVLAYTGGPMPYDVTVTITNSGTTATVSHTSHNMATNDKVQIKGASHWQNNGVFAITKINDNSYSYTMPSAPGSNPTGTIKATYAALEGTTDSNGAISTSRSFTSAQPITGKARYSSSAPYKKTTEFTSSINSTSGMDLTVQLLPDQ